MRGSILIRKRIGQWATSLTYPIGVPMIAQPLSTASQPMTSASNSRNEITAMLRAWSDGEEHASDELIRAVYDQLRRQARKQLRRERRDHTLDTAALINEAYIKLVQQRSVKWNDREHFYALSAQLMRRILVDYARAKYRQKRGSHQEHVDVDDVSASPQLASAPLDVDLIALDEALERLAEFDEQQVKVVELRYFAGLEIEETAKVLNISAATVKRDWVAAKAWLKHELTR
jgi:RNA polymerase sigma-70 factor (ECF subfamily)